MKKAYQKPCSTLVMIESVSLFAVSGGTGGTIPDAGWGAPDKDLRNPFWNFNPFNL